MPGPCVGGGAGLFFSFCTGQCVEIFTVHMALMHDWGIGLTVYINTLYWHYLETVHNPVGVVVISCIVLASSMILLLISVAVE